MEFSHAIWCRWSAKGCAPVLESPKSRAALARSVFHLGDSLSLTLALRLSFLFFISRPASRGYCREGFRGSFVFEPPALFTRVSRSAAVLRASAVPPATSVANDADTRPFISRDIWRVNMQEQKIHGNLNDSSSRRLSSVLSPGCIIHATQNVARVSPYACFASKIFKTHRHNMHRVIAYKRSG